MSKTKFDEQIAAVEREGDLGVLSFLTEKEVREGMAKEDALLQRDKRRAVHGVWVWLVRIMGIGAICLFCVVLWHLLAPPLCRWLSPNEAEQLTTGFFASLVGYMVRSVQRFI